MAIDESHPKLRPLDIRPVENEGQSLLLLRDPLTLSDKTVLIPQDVGPILLLCDGTRDVEQLGAALAIRCAIRIGPGLLREFVVALDQALLLDNARSRAARAAAVELFRAAPFRPPTLAGSSYPEDPEALSALLNGYGSDTDRPDPRPCRGLISPHIDYERGGPVYAQVWQQAAEAVRAADLAIVLGTDHSGGEGDVTLTRQSYATPYGLLPTPGPLVDAIAGAVGDDAVFAGELFHRDEHSIELAAVWLHAIRSGQACEVLPVLCGPMARFFEEGRSPQTDPGFAGFVDAVAANTQGRRVLVVAAADLAHVGPVFGGRALGLEEKARLQAADGALLEQICAGDGEGFLEAIRRVENRNNVCGASPIYLALRLLGATTGERVSYALCPADARGTSVVSICGVLLR